MRRDPLCRHCSKKASILLGDLLLCLVCAIQEIQQRKAEKPLASQANL